MWAYIHGDCGQAAFLLKEMPKPGEVSDATKATWLDGTPIKNGDTIKCDSCKMPIYEPISVDNIVPWGDEE